MEEIMKKRFITIVLAASLLLGTGGHLFAQGTQSSDWKGTVRFNPAALLLGLLTGLPEVDATWTPYVTDNLGIPVNIDVAFTAGIFGIGLQTGIEGVFFQGAKDKQGLYINALVGGMYLEAYGASLFAFTTEANIGYQFVADKGFVFTPAVGIRYDTYTDKVAFSLMLDIGFAYR